MIGSLKISTEAFLKMRDNSGIYSEQLTSLGKTLSAKFINAFHVKASLDQPRHGNM